MTKVLILGAGGQVARHVIERLRKSADIHLYLYLRRAQRLEEYRSENVELIEGDR